MAQINTQPVLNASAPAGPEAVDTFDRRTEDYLDWMENNQTVAFPTKRRQSRYVGLVASLAAAAMAGVVGLAFL